MEPLVKTSILTIGNPAFDNNGNIPARYTCQGENINPAITIKEVVRRNRKTLKGYKKSYTIGLCVLA